MVLEPTASYSHSLPDMIIRDRQPVPIAWSRTPSFRKPDRNPLDMTSATEKKRQRILIVDDEAGVRQVLTIHLEYHGFETLQACDGQDALTLLENESVNLVITDVMMPVKDGLELLGELKTRCPQLPVIIVTGMPELEAAVQCIKVGAADYLSKPIDFSKLVQTVNNTLEEIRKIREATVADTDVLEVYRRHLAGYELLETLGEGNMGFVFLARKAHNTDSKRFAIKVSKPGHGDDEKRQARRERFLREANAASSVEHPNIVGIVEFGLAEQEEIPFIVMEYVEGQSLGDLIDENLPLDLIEKIRIVRQIADAVSAIHAKNICHRDITPRNILLDKELNPKLTDFGIALLPDSDLTVTSHIVGTPVYLSPEGFKSPKVDPRSDLFSLGAVAYEFFLLERAFAGEVIGEFAHNVQFQRPLEPRKIMPDFPIELQYVLARLLKKNPDQRYQSAAELIVELDAVLETQTARSSIFQHLVDRIWHHDWS